MKIEDLGFIISITSFEENSLLIKILSKENGIISGYLKHVKKDRNLYQIGNLVKFTWSARHINQLGMLKIELLKSYLSYFIENKFYLHLLDNINILLNSFLYEKYLENNLYPLLENIFDLIINNSNISDIVKEYLIFENTVLNIVGSGIIFDNKCELEDLYYISPKTGLAVSKIKGEPYKDKLLIFPKIFKYNENITNKDIEECFDILHFFINKYLTFNNINNKYSIINKSRNNLLSIILYNLNNN